VNSDSASGAEAPVEPARGPRSEAPGEPTILATRSLPADAGVLRVQLDLEITPELDCFEGHFDGLPLLPGVTQLHWAVMFGRRHFPLPPRFTHMSAIKFVRVITPCCRLVLSLEFEATRGELRFRYDLGDMPCSSGSVGFGP